MTIRSIIEAQPKQRLQARLEKNTARMACGCIEYKGATNNSGYRKLNFRHNGEHVQVYAHRLFFVLATGKEIPSHLVVDHKCQNRSCVNPAHLQLVKPETNSRLVHSRARAA